MSVDREKLLARARKAEDIKLDLAAHPAVRLVFEHAKERSAQHLEAALQSKFKQTDDLDHQMQMALCYRLVLVLMEELIASGEEAGQLFEEIDSDAVYAEDRIA